MNRIMNTGRITTHITLVAFLMLVVWLSDTHAAALGKQATTAVEVGAHRASHVRTDDARQAGGDLADDEDGEYSDEDDDEEDAEQLQLSNIQQQQNEEAQLEDSAEEDEEDDDDFEVFRHRRRRRDVAVVDSVAQAPVLATQHVVTAEVPVVESTGAVSVGNSISNSDKQEATEVEEAAVVPIAASTSTPAIDPSSVLILIRDAIKKVTTRLPQTQQVATSALQYFQLFEHFLQQTIEQAIGDDDDEDEETVTATSTPDVNAATEDVIKAPEEQVTPPASVAAVVQQPEPVAAPVTIVENEPAKPVLEITEIEAAAATNKI